MAGCPIDHNPLLLNDLYDIRSANVLLEQTMTAHNLSMRFRPQGSL
jgi:hypothetical protein